MVQYFSCNEVYGHTTVLEHIHTIQNINPCLDSLNCTFFSSSSISRISYKDKSLDCFLLMFTNQLIEQNAMIIVGENANICIRFDRECVHRDAPIFLSFVFELFFFYILHICLFHFLRRGRGYMYLITSIIQIFWRHTYTCQFMTLISFVDVNIRKQI